MFVIFFCMTVGGLLGLIPGWIVHAPADGFAFGLAAGLIVWAVLGFLAFKKIRDRGCKGRQMGHP